MSEWIKHRTSARRVGRCCGWMALGLLLFTMLTGYGISHFRAVTGLTFGVLNKAVSQRWHHYMDVPLLLFVLVHVVVAVWGRLGIRKDRRCEE